MWAGRGRTSVSLSVWCTGAGKGIGRAVAFQLAAAGASVAASARTSQDLESLADEARAIGGTVVPVAVDVTDPVAVEDAYARAEAAVGPLDLVILNAGTHIPMSATSFSIETVRTLVETNIMGAVHGLAAVLPRFIERKRGHIAVVSSIAGYRGLPTAAAYGATKAALINMCEALKPELDAVGVRITVINPGFVRTPLTDKNTFDMPFLMEVDAAADRIVRGLRRESFEITFPRRFTWFLKVLRCLPYRLYFPLIRRFATP